MSANSLQQRFHAATQDPQAQLGRLALERPLQQPDAELVPHVLSPALHVYGRSFVACACGFVMETFDIVVLPICPIEEAEIEYLATVEGAARHRDETIRLWREIGTWHQRDIAAGQR